MVASEGAACDSDGLGGGLDRRSNSMTTGEKIIRIECDRKLSKVPIPLDVTRWATSETAPFRDGGVNVRAILVEVSEAIVAPNVEEANKARRRRLRVAVIVGLWTGLSTQQVVATVHVGIYGTPVTKEFVGRVGGRSPRATAITTSAELRISWKGMSPLRTCEYN